MGKKAKKRAKARIKAAESRVDLAVRRLDDDELIAQMGGYVVRIAFYRQDPILIHKETGVDVTDAGVAAMRAEVDARDLGGEVLTWINRFCAQALLSCVLQTATIDGVQA
jgi:hypothetical protein